MVNGHPQVQQYIPDLLTFLGKMISSEKRLFCIKNSGLN